MIAGVWAPTAGRVTIVADGVERPLARSASDEGWWIDDRSLAIGARYGFRLDGEEQLLPDPRGRSLPDGVHGISEVVDTTPLPLDGWAGRRLDGSVLYELHIGTFTAEGTLDSAIGCLDHLVGLGIDFVELLPVNAFNGDRNWGYDGVAWFAVQHSYGGPAAYRRFVTAPRTLGVDWNIKF